MTVLELTPAVGAAAADNGPPPAPSRRWGVALFVFFAAVYGGVGALLTLRYGLIDADGISRVANAGYVLMSRDPHLSAIGFVWNPLPSLVEIPLLKFSQWWPELRTQGLAAVIQSALFMAGGALMVRRIALDRGVGAGWRSIAVICFALNPVIIIYGGSGMSEAAEAFTTLWCVRYLLLWLQSRRTGDLAWAGVALGVGYLARYEVAVTACGVGLLVAIVEFLRSRRESRISSAVLSVVIVLFPFGVAFVVWALTGWIVNDTLFATLTSKYGNGSQIAESISRSVVLAQAGDQSWTLISARLLAMQPFVGIAVILGVVTSMLGRKFDALVPVAVFGPVLAFAAWGQHTSTTFGWFRFYLLAIPLVACVALTCWNAAGSTKAPPWRLTTAEAKAGAVLLTASLLIGFPVTAKSMLNQDIGNQQLQFGLNSLLDPQNNRPEDQWYRRMLNNERLLADYLDSKKLPNGSVLMDTFHGWGIWLASDDPKQFVVTSDYDFRAALNRPWDFGIQYIVDSNPAHSAANAVNLRYPSFWYDGAGIATMVYSGRGDTGDERWRVFKVVKPTSKADLAKAASETAQPPAKPGG
ncbi:hypothetical protein [Mycolicibacterium komossense]|uniref:hypothetical protein n=1 Tax=Mycolicibacterium komossense TaxID=1779 RepID=UPI0021F2C7E1|nr:hypothetical protein [Mycolicibacterium komossense]